jgi:putative tricarboxylic transport membrane protein
LKFNDAVFGVVLAALSAAILIHIQAFPKTPGQNVGPALFPGILAAGIGIGGLILMVRGWATRSSIPWLTLAAWTRSPQHVLACVLVIGSLVFYILAANTLGFLITATLILVALFAVLRVPLRWNLPVAVIVSLAIHFAFYKMLKVPLPWGLLKDHIW